MSFAWTDNEVNGLHIGAVVGASFLVRTQVLGQSGASVLCLVPGAAVYAAATISQWPVISSIVNALTFDGVSPPMIVAGLATGVTALAEASNGDFSAVLDPAKWQQEGMTVLMGAAAGAAAFKVADLVVSSTTKK